MRVLFISANREDINMPTLPMGLGCVAAATQKANHDVLFVDLLTTSDIRPVIRKTIDEFAPQVIGIMAGAGCCEVSLGFESGNNDILRAMNKRFDTSEIRQANRILADYGIRRMGFLMLGAPGETRKSVAESFEFAESLDLDALKITLGIRIYPHTDLAKTAIEEGLITADDDLLFPRFYIDQELKGWLEKYVNDRAKNHPNWFF